MSADKSQFDIGYQPPVQQQPTPGWQSKLDPQPSVEYVPDEATGGYQLYKAAGKLKDKKALITGGDSGIGRATAVLFAMEGADSFIVYLPEEEEDAKETVRLVEKYGRKCYTFQANLKSKDKCKEVIDKAFSTMGSLDILFNNHAYQMMQKDITEIPEEQWEHTFATNIHPFFYLTKYAIPHLKRGAVIINDASVNAYVGRPDLLDYTASKGAVVAFTYGLANQFVGKGIRVNAVAPGPVWTPLVAATMSKEALEQFTSPMGRPGQPSEIASCVVFLASSDSSQLSGQVIHCNGGVIVHG
ncbi:3-oxoacyl-(acyl-carrier-protein) reductase [Teratosphaeria destructans]|uniref:3-oxoacyl-(Acyl-carrier-protein) reductase n=1 Tax=Teratosphaeria destructans TaxID=418781 RepID=A0A9W7SHS4_9PEZI|nr:3-oxoacyl-(acyl-carrier-protein) reductase [Teratosphaeria destructans]